MGNFVADSNPPFRFDADSDSTFPFDVDPDPTFHFDADPDPPIGFVSGRLEEHNTRTSPLEQNRH
jgi:hypothetical protein